MSIPNKIAIFGGSFDPVHKGHTELAKLALEKLRLSKIIFVPTSRNPLKHDSPVASNEDRIQMLSLALLEFDKFEISQIESARKDVPSYSIDTIASIKNKYAINKENLFFLIGADNIKSLHMWKDYRQLFNLCTFVVFGRDQINSDEIDKISQGLSREHLEKISSNFIQFNFNLSSTVIRDMFKVGRQSDAANALEPKVFEYILQHNLYI